MNVTRVSLGGLTELINQYESLGRTTGVNKTNLLLNQEKLILAEQERIVKAGEEFDKLKTDFKEF